MTVISITIEASEEQTVSGIPRTVAISTNIPSSIFYTLDGSDPTLYSSVYTDAILLPTGAPTLILKIFATNGIDSSSIVTETYFTNMIGNSNLRTAHAATLAQSQASIANAYPFGNPPIQPNAGYTSTGDAGITVNNEELPSTSTAFDGSGNPTAFTNETYDTTNYSILYSTTDAIGQTGGGVGNLPANVKIEIKSAPPNTSEMYTKTFDPRAFVIFQDVASENPQDPPSINRMYFSLDNPETSRDGNYFYSCGLDAPPVNGSFLRSHYNPRTNCITYYYLDTWSNKWIISTTPYVQNGNWDGNLGGMVLSKQSGAGFVYEWTPFQRRVLF